MRRGTADDGDHQRRAGEPQALVRDMFRLGIGIFGDERRGDRLARLLPGVTLEDDETPRRQLAVIGYPGGDGQQRLEFGRRGAGGHQLVRLYRAATPQKINGIGHEGLQAPLASTLHGVETKGAEMLLAR